MSNLGLILKVNIINEIGLNKIKNADSKEQNKMVFIALLFILGIGAIVFYMFKICLYISDFLAPMNNMDLLIIMGFTGGMLFTLFTSLYKSSSYLFQSKDFDMLTSLPIKESTILTSKIAMLIFSNYLYSSIFIIIPCIVYFMKVECSVTYILYLLVLFLVSPLIPIVISAFISYFIGNISSKLKYKNLVMVALSVILLIVYMIAATQVESIATSLLQNSSSIIDVIGKIYPPAYYFTDTLVNNSITSLILFLIMSLIPFLAFILIFAKGFRKINSRMNESYKAKEYKTKELKTSKPIIALLKKEINIYLSSSIYVMNTSFSVILLFIGTIGLLIFGIEQINELLSLNIDMNLLKPQIILVFMFVMATTCTTYCSISFEGKNIWILKSSPIEEVDIFKAKILMNLLINTPISLLSFWLIGGRLTFDIQFIIIMTFTIIAMGILISVSGLLANLYFPNLNWKNEVAVVKRSIGIMIVLFGTMIYVGAFGLVYVLIKTMSLNIYLIIFTIITYALNIILWNTIKTKGVKKFRQL